MRAHRGTLKEKYGRTFDEVNRIMFKYDPMGMNFGDNEDEYEPEVGTILPRLRSGMTDEECLVAIAEELAHWFDPVAFSLGDAKTRRQLLPIAQDVMAVLRDGSSSDDGEKRRSA